MVQDYPDNFGRQVPGNTVELETGFSVPWVQSTNLAIAARPGSSSFTINFNDPNWIYYVDMVNVSSDNDTVFRFVVSINGADYVSAANHGSIIIPLRTNPSIQLIDGDSLKVTVFNLDAAQHTFAVHINGSKVIRPVSFGHPPSASWSASVYIASPNQDILFTDESAYNPTEWDWDFDDGTPHSTSKNPVHAYSAVGNYYPILKASNQYGYDTYARASPIVISNIIDLTKFTEVDPNGQISVSYASCSFSSFALSAAAYVYKDYGSGYFSTYEVRFKFRVDSISVDINYVFVFGLSNSIGALYAGSGVKLTLRVYRTNSTTYNLYFTLFNGTTVTTQTNHGISLSTDYYVKVVHSSGSTSATVYVYSDSGYSNLLFSLSLTNAGINTNFRYLYALSGLGASASGVTSGETGYFILS